MKHRATIAVAIASVLLISSTAVYAQSQSDPRANLPLLDPPSDDLSLLDRSGDHSLLDRSGDRSLLDRSGDRSLLGDMQASIEERSNELKGQLLGGDEGSACEAILCLSTGGPPSECMPSLRRYFSINLSKPWKTIQARINFLKMCPTSDDTPQMGTLVEAIGHGAGRCDSASLNQSLMIWNGGDSGDYYISNQMPSYCATYFNHEYTDIDSTKPRYVGVPGAGGRWEDGQATAAAADTKGAIPASKDRAAVGF